MTAAFIDLAHKIEGVVASPLDGVLKDDLGLDADNGNRASGTDENVLKRWLQHLIEDLGDRLPLFFGNLAVQQRVCQNRPSLPIGLRQPFGELFLILFAVVEGH